MNVDGASNSFESGARQILTSPDIFAIEYALRFAFQASNNQAKYEAFLVGLKITKELGIRKLKTFKDS